MSEPQDWRTLYAAAMLESDTARLEQRIQRADEAIHERLRELPDTHVESHELRSALSYLRNLRRLTTNSL